MKNKLWMLCIFAMMTVLSGIVAPGIAQPADMVAVVGGASCQAEGENPYNCSDQVGCEASGQFNQCLGTGITECNFVSDACGSCSWNNQSCIITC